MTAIRDRSAGGYQHIPASHPPALPGQVHGQGVLPLIWPDTRSKERKADDHFDMLREKAADRIRED